MDEELGSILAKHLANQKTEAPKAPDGLKQQREEAKVKEPWRYQPRRANGQFASKDLKERAKSEISNSLFGADLQSYVPGRKKTGASSSSGGVSTSKDATVVSGSNSGPVVSGSSTTFQKQSAPIVSGQDIVPAINKLNLVMVNGFNSIGASTQSLVLGQKATNTNLSRMFGSLGSIGQKLNRTNAFLSSIAQSIDEQRFNKPDLSGSQQDTTDSSKASTPNQEKKGSNIIGDIISDFGAPIAEVGAGGWAAAKLKKLMPKGLFTRGFAEAQAALPEVAPVAGEAAEKGAGGLLSRLTAEGAPLMKGAFALGKAIPFLGDAYQGYQSYKESGSIGRGITGALGSFGGRFLGGSAGSLVGPAGTVAGEIGGSIAGTSAANHLYDSVFGGPDVNRSNTQNKLDEKQNLIQSSSTGNKSIELKGEDITIKATTMKFTADKFEFNGVGGGQGGSPLASAGQQNVNVEPGNNFGGQSGSNGPVVTNGGGRSGGGGGSGGVPGLRGPDSSEPIKEGKQGTYRPVYKLGDQDTSDAVIRTIAGEARMSSKHGIDAVINTMFNRLGSKAYGRSNNLFDVAAARGQFAGFNKGHPTAAQAEYIRARIKAIASGSVEDVTHGANEFRTDTYRGQWYQKHARDGVDIGGNLFARNRKADGMYSPYDKPREPEPSEDEAKKEDKPVVTPDKKDAKPTVAVEKHDSHPNPDAVVGRRLASATDGLAALDGTKDHDAKGNALIKKFLRTGGVGMDPASVDWCAAAVQASMQQNGIKGAGLVANNWAKWGRAVDPTKEPLQKGDVYVNTRGKGAGNMGGHAGIVGGPLAEDGTIPVIAGDVRVNHKNGNDGHMVTWDNQPMSPDTVIRRATPKELIRNYKDPILASAEPPQPLPSLVDNSQNQALTLAQESETKAVADAAPKPAKHHEAKQHVVDNKKHDMDKDPKVNEPKGKDVDSRSRFADYYEV